MEVILFLGALIILTAIFYGFLSRHQRNRRKDHVTDKLIRDRFDHQT
jgi:preprotein translocase subunit YajC